MDDEQLMRELRRAADLMDPMPDHLVATARAAFTWRTVDAELAELVFDSLTAAAPVRGTAEPRLLTFQTSELTIEAELDHGEGRGRMVGWLTPPAPVEIEIRHRRGTVTVTTDPLGRFAVGGLPRGPMRLLCRPAGTGSAVVTDWFTG
jgi:hypothetical protein